MTTIRIIESEIAKCLDLQSKGQKVWVDDWSCCPLSEKLRHLNEHKSFLIKFEKVFSNLNEYNSFYRYINSLPRYMDRVDILKDICGSWVDEWNQAIDEKYWYHTYSWQHSKIQENVTDFAISHKKLYDAWRKIYGSSSNKSKSYHRAEEEQPKLPTNEEKYEAFVKTLEKYFNKNKNNIAMYSFLYYLKFIYELGNKKFDFLKICKDENILENNKDLFDFNGYKVSLFTKLMIGYAKAHEDDLYRNWFCEFADSSVRICGSEYKLKKSDINEMMEIEKEINSSSYTE